MICLAVVLLVGLVFLAGLGAITYYLLKNKARMAQIGLGIYSYFWVYIGSLISFMGLYLFFSGLIGVILPEFIYTDFTGVYTSGTGLWLGLIVFVLGMLLAGVHFGIMKIVTGRFSGGTGRLHKLFVLKQLFLWSLIFFFGAADFVILLAGYLTGSTAIAAAPGEMLALTLAALPFWAFMMGRLLMLVRSER